MLQVGQVKELEKVRHAARRAASVAGEGRKGVDAGERVSGWKLWGSRMWNEAPGGQWQHSVQISGARGLVAGRSTYRAIGPQSSRYHPTGGGSTSVRPVMSAIVTTYSKPMRTLLKPPKSISAASRESLLTAQPQRTCPTRAVT